jgi:nicotinate-nucleotide adenylyltransferase
VRRIGLIGGTFDPIHNGHVLLALFAREALDLAEVIFIPAADPPHKDSTHARANERMAMVELAIAGIAGFSASRIELDRPGKSYTVDTLRQLHVVHPQSTFFLIIGADNVAQMSTWHDPQGILDQCTVVAGKRLATAAAVDDVLARQMHFIDTPLIELSSTQIRQRLRDGRAVRAMVPDAVECFIREKGLYRSCI